MGKVIPIDPKDQEELRRQEQMLEILDYLKKQVEAGNIKEFVCTSLDLDGLTQIHCSTLDAYGGVGLFEIGKNLLIQAEIGFQ